MYAVWIYRDELQADPGGTYVILIKRVAYSQVGQVSPPETRSSFVTLARKTSNAGKWALERAHPPVLDTVLSCEGP